jgi:hypothetical protein
MDEEINDEEGFEEEESPPAKRLRTETIVLDEEEAEIASGLRPILGTERAAPQLEEDDTGSQNGGDSGEGGAVEDLRGDGYGAGFEDNGVCLSFFHDIHILISAITDIPLWV